MKLLLLYSAISFLICVTFIAGCGSGEYDIEQYKINYTEKELVYDTIKTLANDNIKEDVDTQNKEERKYAYKYVVQVGAFVIKANFENFYAKAQRELGSEVYFEFLNSLYKIRLGSFTNRAEAVLLLEKVKGLGYWDAFIITRRN